jgi:hypothetical protein
MHGSVTLSKRGCRAQTLTQRGMRFSINEREAKEVYDVEPVEWSASE